MKNAIRTGFVALSSCGLIACGLGQWSATNLHPASASESAIYGVYGSSQVGYAAVNGIWSASKWSGTQESWVNLNPSGSTQSYALSTDGSNQLGAIWFGEEHHATLWGGSSGVYVNLTPTGAARSEGHRSFNGVQVGAARFNYVRKAGMWTGTAASWVELHPVNAVESFAYDTDGVQQVGAANINSTYGACLWTGTATSYVSLHPPTASQSYALGVDGGQQVGHSVVSRYSHASLWSGTAISWVDLNPAGARSSIAFSVDGGQQVGSCVLHDGRVRAGMWTGTAASWVDLHAYLPAHYSMSEAISVWSDANTTVIGGYAINTQTQRKEAIVWRSATMDFTFSLDKTTIAGQNSVRATVTMPSVRPTNTVFRIGDNSSLVSTPSIAIIPTDRVTTSFRVTVNPVTHPLTTTISATLGPITRLQSLTLIPLNPTALAFAPSQTTGGAPVTCRVVMNGVAGPGGAVIGIADNSPFAEAPGNVTVPAGSNQASFSILTSAVTTPTLVVVTATAGGGAKTGVFRINP
ncbi:MAG: hypothetical protein ABL949_01645 [Fimbriimonadaceae bacterium]